jgi:predicted TIM-barrel fold metal-dependent hydrolase
MLQNHRLFDVDAHVLLSPEMWRDLPEAYVVRRPRPIRLDDAGDLGRAHTAWFVEGRVSPHPFGPGAHPSKTPEAVMPEYGAKLDTAELSPSSLDMSDPNARLRDMDRKGIDVQVIFPTPHYAQMTVDPGFEAALFRSYNRYIARQCRRKPERLKWAGLLPLRDAQEGCEAVKEMVALDAKAVLVFGTVGERLLSDRSFTPVWEEVARSRLPVCIHMGMSFTPYEQLTQSVFDAHILGMCLPVHLAFVALVGHGMLDRYPDMKVAFLEFGSEWLLYMVPRMDHYLPLNRNKFLPGAHPLPQRAIEDYIKSGKIFLAPESEDRLLPVEMELFGDDQFLYASDIPHGEGRHDAASVIIERTDLSDTQKRKILYDNALRFYGNP